jgi:uncharacterized protein (TIGR00251 family)
MCIREHKRGSTIQVRVTPRSARNLLVRGKGDALGVRLNAPPVEGRANRELIKFFAKTFHLSPSSISILKGRGSRDKVLLVEGADKADLETRLEEAWKRR